MSLAIINYKNILLNMILISLDVNLKSKKEI